MKKLAALILFLGVLIAACGGSDDEQPPSEFAPRNLTVLVGGGVGTSSLNEYYPNAIEIRAGDTITWRMNGQGDDPHTVTFAPDLSEVIDIVPKPNGNPDEFIFATTLVDPTRRAGQPVEEHDLAAYINSGIMFGYQVGEGVPLIDTFSLKFPEPGTYEYSCGIHEFHRGLVVVKDASTADLPNQVAIDENAQREIAFGQNIVDSLQGLVAQETTVLDIEPGPDDTSRFIVAAGMGTPKAEVLEFFPPSMTIDKGDTITWISSRFHAVVFGGDEGVPPFYLTERRVRGTPYVVANPRVLFPSEPSSEYDGMGFRSSGLIGYGQRPGGLGFTLTFTEAGTFPYACPIHSGMVGRITVRGE